MKKNMEIMMYKTKKIKLIVLIGLFFDYKLFKGMQLLSCINITKKIKD